MADPLTESGGRFLEIGATGLKRTGGYVQEEFVPELIGSRGRKVIRRMIDNSAIIGGTLLAIEMLSRQTKWDVTPAGEENAALEAADFVKGCLFDDQSYTFQDEVAEIFTMLPWGFQYSETVFKIRGGDVADPKYRSRFTDNRIGLRKLAPRAQETLVHWEFDESGGVQAMVQNAAPTYRDTEIKIQKALLFRTTSRLGNPEGRSILRSAWEDWYYGQNIKRIEAIGIERDLAGYPVLYLPPEIMDDGASDGVKAVYQTYKTLITNIRRDEQEGVILPAHFDDRGNRLYELILQTTGGSRSFDTNSIIGRYDQRIAASMLADFMLLGSQAVGSYALADSKINLFSVAMGAFMDIICDVFTRHLFPRLFALNGMPAELIPRLTHSSIDELPLSEVADYIQKLSGAGFPLFPSADGKLETQLLEMANLNAQKPEVYVQQAAEAEAQAQQDAQLQLDQQVEMMKVQSQLNQTKAQAASEAEAKELLIRAQEDEIQRATSRPYEIIINNPAVPVIPPAPLRTRRRSVERDEVGRILTVTESEVEE